eukprot:5333306-Prymnesium_polylepis.1
MAQLCRVDQKVNPCDGVSIPTASMSACVGTHSSYVLSSGSSAVLSHHLTAMAKSPRVYCTPAMLSLVRLANPEAVICHTIL